MKKIAILFVCHGNICRSPMAEFVMKRKVADAGVAERFEIASAATSTEELGEPVYPGTRRILARNGIDCSGKRARQLTKADYQHYDLLVGMDSENLWNMQRMTGGDKDGKVRLLLDFTDAPGEISDPWYHGDFDQTWREVNLGCDALLKYCLEHEKDGSL